MTSELTSSKYFELIPELTSSQFNWKGNQKGKGTDETSQSLVAIILALFVVKSSRVDSFKDTSFICGGGLLGLQEFKPQLFTMIIYPNPVGIMNYQLWTFQIQLLNLFCPS